MTTRRSIGFTPMHTRSEIIECSLLADELGYYAAMVPEAWGLDATVLLTEIALITTDIRPMSSILSIWGRSAATLAMSSATLLDVSDGRYILGLGVSTPAIVEGFHDVEYRAPAAEMDRVVTEIVNLVGGGRAQLLRASEQRPLRLGTRVAHPLDIVVAAMGPRLRHIAATRATGWAPAYLNLDTVRTQMAEMARVRSEHGLDPDSFLVFAPPSATIHPDVEQARAAVASNIAFYICAMGDNYARVLTEQGYGDEVEAVIAANPSPKPGACVVPDEAVRLRADFCAVASPDDAAQALRASDELGAITCIALPPGVPMDTLEAIVRGAAPPPGT
jgi:alkanesulfonate monooxygenase SsuD/methylene tetrahydromethanopterin reductase-like flavin-dependent oxidoreductase (luciferase family)